ncbi:MAG: peroxiredoxin [Pyrinomonadaceae bacterium]
MNVGDIAPDFTLKDQNGDEWTLFEHRGSVVTLLFYPGDNTPVCTAQLCSVRDNWNDFADTDSVVVGISTDSVETHKQFSEKHKFPFPLLSDETGEVINAYEVKSWLPGRAARAVVTINSNGRISHCKTQSLSIFRPSNREVLDAIKIAT